MGVLDQLIKLQQEKEQKQKEIAAIQAKIDKLRTQAEGALNALKDSGNAAK